MKERLPLRILFLLTQDLESPSGLGRYRPLAAELQRRGHQVRVAALHPAFESLADRHPVIDGVPVSYVAPMHVRKSGSQKSYYRAPELLNVIGQATTRLAQEALRDPGELLVVGKPHPMNGFAAWLAHLRGHAFLLDCDDFEAASNRFNGRWQAWGVDFFEKRLPRAAAALTTNTRFTQRRLENGGISPEKITYLPNGVDPRRFAPPERDRVDRLRQELALDGKRVIAFIGTLSLVNHPVDLLLDAYAQICGRDADTALLLVGGGEDYPRLEDQVRHLGLEARVRFAGRVPPEQVPAYYALAEVSVDPVHADDAARGRSPLKLFESWICGVPFVTADVGDRRELIGDPPAGFLVPPGRPEDLADGIWSGLTQPGRSQAAVELGRKRVQGYTWDRLALRLEAALRAIQPGDMERRR